MFKIKGIIISVLLVAFSNSYSSETITVTTGVDTATILKPAGGGQQVGAFGAAFTSADFTSADNGAAAVIISAGNRPGGWQNSLTANSNAIWIGDVDTLNGQSTALYSFPFTVTEATVNSAFITVHYSADDFFGDFDVTNNTNGPNSSVYINGTSVGAGEGNHFGQEFVTARIDVTNLVNTGSNRLYLHAINHATNPAGIMAHAIIEINNSQPSSAQPVPTLSEWSILLLSLLLATFGIYRSKRNY